MMSVRLPIVLTLMLISFRAPADEPATKAPPELLKFLAGRWEGTTQGEPGRGQGERQYEFVLGSKFLRATNRTVYPPQEKNPKGEVHEDLGIYSYDGQKKKLVFRQFHVEGFVNEYVEQSVSADGKTVVLVTERIENIPEGWRARETYKIVGPDEYVEVFELAQPQKDFALYSEGHWKRTK